MPSGSKPGEYRGGRQKGTPNKATVRKRAYVDGIEKQVLAALLPEQVATISPLDVMLMAMRVALEGGKMGEAASLAAQAAPYLHPRLASTDTTIKSDNVHRLLSEKPKSEAEWLAEHAPTEAANDAATEGIDDAV